MKKNISLLLFSILSLTVYSQDQGTEGNPFGFLQNEIFIEGNIQYSSVDNQTTNNKTTSLGINPKAGYFLFDGFALGLEASYVTDKNTTIISGADADITRKVEETYFAPGIFARYYFLQLGKRFYTYGELGGNYGKSESFTDVDGERDNEISTNIINADLNLGLNYFVNDNIAISFLLSDIISYSSEKVDADDSEPINSLDVNINVLDNFFQTAKFGVLFILN